MNFSQFFKKVIIVLPFYFFTFFSISARPQLHDLSIRVILSKNGDAHITETRQMSIESEGTECYTLCVLYNFSEKKP